MPPKAKPVAGAAAASIYVVTHDKSIDSIYASDSAAKDRVQAMEAEGLTGTIAIKSHKLTGGTVQVSSTATAASADKKTATAAAPKAKASKKTKNTSAEEEKNGDDDAHEEEEAAPKTVAVSTIGKKPTTKTPAEQRAANTSKASHEPDATLPSNMQALLAGSGSALTGMTVVVTGVPPTLGRKNAEKMVTGHGGKLTKSLSKNTNLVVVGNEAGPKKLQQIEELGLKTVDEDGLVALLEKGGDGGNGGDGGAAGKKKKKREVEEEDGEGEGEGEEGAPVGGKEKKAKKVKKVKD